MKSLHKKALYILTVTLGGMLLGSLIFGVKITPVSIVGSFVVPVVIVLASAILRREKPVNKA